jgi:hypothetical protein
MPQLILSLFSTNSLLRARCTIIMRLSLLAFGVSEFHVFHCILPESSIKNITFGFTPCHGSGGGFVLQMQWCGGEGAT